MESQGNNEPQVRKDSEYLFTDNKKSVSFVGARDGGGEGRLRTATTAVDVQKAVTA